jgi:2'-5' RNA ligase
MIDQKTEKTRSFLAIELSDELKLEAEAFLQLLKPKNPDWRYIPSANWHLTLNFFGDISREVLDRIKSTLPEIAKRIQPFSLSLKDFGGFPSVIRPNIFWLGISGDLDKLNVLKDNLDEVFKKLGFQIEARAFKPHITVARPKDRNKKSSSIVLPEKIFIAKTVDQVDRLVLFQSILLREGARYTPLAEFRFGL